MTKPITFTKERLFRETPSVHFSDVGVPGQNGLDLVEHRGFAVSPPLRRNFKQFYTHNHQTDNNRVVQGQRVFELVATEGQMEFEHYRVLLTPEVGALEILPHVYHRSVSGLSGSLLLNHAIRDEEYDENNEFRPAWAVTTPDLALVLLKNNPIYVNGNKEEIEYFMVNGRLPN